MWLRAPQQRSEPLNCITHLQQMRSSQSSRIAIALTKRPPFLPILPIALKLVHVTRQLAEAHYADLSSKPFFAGLVDYSALRYPSPFRPQQCPST